MKNEDEMRGKNTRANASSSVSVSTHGGASAGGARRRKRKLADVKPMPSVKKEAVMERGGGGTTSAARASAKKNNKKKTEVVPTPAPRGDARDMKKSTDGGEGRTVSGKTLKEIIRNNLKIERAEQSRERREKKKKNASDGKKLMKGENARGEDGDTHEKNKNTNTSDEAAAAEDDDEENEEEDEDDGGGGGDGVARGKDDHNRGGVGGSRGREQVAAPQVKVVDGQIVINEQSLEVARTDEKEFEEKRKVVNEGAGGLGAKLNAGSYTNKSRTPRWSDADTELFYKGISAFGLDFSMIERLFPNRSRPQVKRKYLAEETRNRPKLEACLKAGRDFNTYKDMIERVRGGIPDARPDGAAQDKDKDAHVPQEQEDAAATLPEPIEEIATEEAAE